MFGVGGQELVIIGLLLLIVFGPTKVGQMARDVGRFAYGARGSVEDFKAELTSAVDHPNRQTDDDQLEEQESAEKEEDAQ